ncbi:MAG: helix-turn-helix transcriptional regulator, partial [Candidatus Dormibacteraceae bacterium]
MSELLTVEELSEFLHIPVKTLYQWRTKKYGPQGKKIGRYVRYQKEKVLAW